MKVIVLAHSSASRFHERTITLGPRSSPYRGNLSSDKKGGIEILSVAGQKRGYNDFYAPQEFFRRRTFLHFLDEKNEKI